MNRRSFFRLIPATAAAPMVASALPKGEARSLEAPELVRLPIPDVARTINRCAQFVAEQIHFQLAFSQLCMKLSDYVSIGDTVMHHGRRFHMGNHLESTQTIFNAGEFFGDNEGFRHASIMPQATALACGIADRARDYEYLDDEYLLFAPLPCGAPNQGVLFGHGETSHLIVRAVCSFEHRVLAQLLTFDVFFGVA